MPWHLRQCSRWPPTHDELVVLETSHQVLEIENTNTSMARNAPRHQFVCSHMKVLEFPVLYYA